MTQSSKKNWIIALCLVAFFSLFAGYYLSYRINEKEKTKLEIIQDIMENEWYYGIDYEDIEATLEKKMILSMQDLEKDPHTRYMVSLDSLADSFTGLGITIHKYGEYYIVGEVESKRSIEDGVKVNDILVSINSQSIKNKTKDEITQMINARDDVRLGVIRDNLEIKDENITYINTRVTHYSPVSVFTKEYNDKIAYLQISEFNLDTAMQVESYLQNLDYKYNDLVIDLRGNLGGYISAVRDVADLFLISNKVVMSTVDKYNNTSYVKTVNDGAYLFDEIYILTDNDSASGSEALVAALSYHLNNVTLYGEKTYGKGSAQKTYYFDDGTYFHYTYALWKTPENKTINHVGVFPDIEDVNEGISSYTLYEKEYELYDYGDGVKSIQNILKILNYYQGEDHSFMDEKTVEALKKFQQDYNLEETGKVDNPTKGILSKLVYDDEVKFKSEQLNRVLALFN